MTGKMVFFVVGFGSAGVPSVRDKSPPCDQRVLSPEYSSLVIAHFLFIDYFKAHGYSVSLQSLVTFLCLF